MGIRSMKGGSCVCSKNLLAVRMMYAYAKLWCATLPGGHVLQEPSPTLNLPALQLRHIQCVAEGILTWHSTRTTTAHTSTQHMEHTDTQKVTHTQRRWLQVQNASFSILLQRCRGVNFVVQQPVSSHHTLMCLVHRSTSNNT